MSGFEKTTSVSLNPSVSERQYMNSFTFQGQHYLIGGFRYEWKPDFGIYVLEKLFVEGYLTNKSSLV